ncbi:glycine zipper domain-containing protein [Zwartia sp. IMCC34845]|nr:glycine zipper domain-containing protein [Zwartia vadi]MDN3987879.1 glycine zipper domain-containing protein [Zwartia vadi]
MASAGVTLSGNRIQKIWGAVGGAAIGALGGYVYDKSNQQNSSR